ncbi:serine/threonine-protein kinase-like protein CCR2 [Euphorbia lathyris]|uniref:serine/threonine-protein kinase-like protein CCR2 n=1 Tax=Euphorbia lathyris TaxID=212925 RepID=UPI0033137767
MSIRISGLLIYLLVFLPIAAFGYGSSGPIAAAFGQNGFFCAIDAGGKQNIICWNKLDNFTAPTSTSYFSSLPSMASLAGGEEILCGITSNTSQAFCFSLLKPGINLVPTSFRKYSYSQISVGKYHACAIKGSYYSDLEYGNVDCWESNQTSNSFRNSGDSLFLRDVVSGDGFSCGVSKEDGVFCWGPRSTNLGIPSDHSADFEILASGRNSVCGIKSSNNEVECWGDTNEFGTPPIGTRFTRLTTGAHHFCGVHEDNHQVLCWGTADFSSVPKGSGFMTLASSDYTSCGVREVDLVLDCWGVHRKSLLDYSPPLQLCSPGRCSFASCPNGKFQYNASILNEAQLTSLCVRKDLKICLPCATKCSQGFFPSSMCNENADRVCSSCSLCQNSSCSGFCGLPSSLKSRQTVQQQQIKKLAIIVGSSVVVALLILIGWCVVPRKTKHEENRKNRFTFCLAKPVVEADPDPSPHPVSITSGIGETQVFRLSELKDATHGFKEFNELGRGSFGFVYKAVLSDGRQVAVKRANAATIIHTNSREFEAELDTLCSIRHINIVNLLGYCEEMGERLLVYELMPHGSLHDHLHGELSPLDWSMRLKISLQAAKGLEYLHTVVKPPIVHGDLKTSNILLDSEWGGRIADFGLLSSNDKDLKGDMESDVYDFGIVLLEILSGRKAYDRESSPPGIIEWALPLIRKGRAAAVIDRSVSLPRNVEPLLKLADVAELALRENPSDRPTISTVTCFLDQIIKIGLTLS